MGAPKFSEVVVIRYTHVPRLLPEDYKVWLKNQKFSTSGTVPIVTEWYSRIIFRERYLLPPKSKVLFSEWRVLMDEQDFFTVNNILYDQAVLILGVDRSYWVFFKNDPSARREEGCGVLDISYCGCCMDVRYLAVAEAMKRLIK